MPSLLPPLVASLPPGLIKTLLAMWLFALGSAVGSFLNVVIHRLPAGMSLSRPGSHCPKCKHPIRWYDNVPVLGWLWLRGRCRDCGASISPRYPIVEAVAGCVFLLIAAVEGFSGGANLPIRPEPVAGGLLVLPPSPGQLVGLVAYHLLLLSTLLAAAGIEYDGRSVPLRLFLPAAAAGTLAPLVWPHLHPVPAGPWLAGPPAGFADAAAGVAAGAALGLAVWPAVGRERRAGFLAAAACVGLFLGWQAVVAIVVAVLAVQIAAGLLGRLRNAPAVELPTTWLAVATLAWILAWEPILARWPL